MFWGYHHFRKPPYIQSIFPFCLSSTNFVYPKTSSLSTWKNGWFSRRFSGAFMEVWFNFMFLSKSPVILFLLNQPLWIFQGVLQLFPWCFWGGQQKWRPSNDGFSSNALRARGKIHLQLPTFRNPCPSEPLRCHNDLKSLPHHACQVSFSREVGGKWWSVHHTPIEITRGSYVLYIPSGFNNSYFATSWWLNPPFEKSYIVKLDHFPK